MTRKRYESTDEKMRKRATKVFKRLSIVALLAAFVLGVLVAIAMAGEGFSFKIKAKDHPSHFVAFMPDGTVEIDGQPIERLRDPEIKEAIISIADSLKCSNDRAIKEYYLEELEKCLNSK